MTQAAWTVPGRIGVLGLFSETAGLFCLSNLHFRFIAVEVQHNSITPARSVILPLHESLTYHVPFRDNPHIERTYCLWCNAQAANDVTVDHGVTYHRVCYANRHRFLVRFGQARDLLPIRGLIDDESK
jgi:hypothetical protein